MPTVPVTTTSGSYEVRISTGLLAEAGPSIAALGKGKRVAVIADVHVAEHFAAPLLESLKSAGQAPALIEVPAGEGTKNLLQHADLCSQLAQLGLGRDALLIALGGGVVGDLAGYVAASYLRGIAFVQIPTSLLAMVDSSVGGKTGVNLPEGKNLVGAFHQPQLVLADLDTLATLPERELRAGMAEVIKYGVIADTELLGWVEKGRPADLAPVIERSVQIKAQIVAEDEKETSGRRALLNFGHTLGHAIENAEGYGQLIHGEAIAVGMRAAALLSQHTLGLTPEQSQRLDAAIAANGLPAVAPGVEPAALRQAMGRDKKAVGGKLRWVLLPKLGEAVVCADVADAHVDEAMAFVSTS